MKTRQRRTLAMRNIHLAFAGMTVEVDELIKTLTDESQRQELRLQCQKLYTDGTAPLARKCYRFWSSHPKEKPEATGALLLARKLCAELADAIKKFFPRPTFRQETPLERYNEATQSLERALDELTKILNT